jgi:hypothetical protein
MKIALFYLLSSVALLAASSYAVASSNTSYTREIQLRDGKHVTCVVNGPAPENAALAPAANNRLTIKERNEAEIIATARLRLIYRDQNQYPDRNTAPHVSCF